MEKPRVSLIVPVYNADAYLTAGVTALLSQTLRDIEVLLVDDGSTDNSAALCDAFAARDSRVRVIHQQNAGAGPARNAGIDAARGDYLMFPDADDLCDLSMVDTLFAAAERTGADVVLCGYRSVDGAGEREVVLPDTEGLLTGAQAVRRFAAQEFPQGLAGYPWNKLYRAEFIRQNALRFPFMRRFQDGMFNLEVFDRAACVYQLRQVLYTYKINDLQGLFQKFPPNMFDLLRQITNAFYEKREKWGLQGEEFEKNIRPFFLNGVVGCVDCVYSPAWGMDDKSRTAYWNMLAADETLRRCAVSDEGLSRYAADVIRLLMEEKYTRLRCKVRLKLFLKAHAGRLFYLLKGNG